MTRKELKALSWEQMYDNIWIYFVITLIIGSIIGAIAGAVSTLEMIPSLLMDTLSSLFIEYAPYASDAELIGFLIIIFALCGISIFAYIIQLAVQIFIAGPFNFSYANIFLKITDGKKVSVGDAFSGFKTFWKASKVYIWQLLFITLWSCLFIIPGYIKVYYSYSMAAFIAIENPDLTALECITRSKQMMKGHKWELFVLDLSFIGWAILTFFSFGIASIWYTPYSNTARANFYKKLKGEL